MGDMIQRLVEVRSVSFVNMTGRMSIKYAKMIEKDILVLCP